MQVGRPSGGASRCRDVIELPQCLGRALPYGQGGRLPTVTWIPSRSMAPQSQEQLHPDARTLETPK